MGMLRSLKDWFNKTFKKEKNMENKMLNEPKEVSIPNIEGDGNKKIENQENKFLYDVKSQVKDPLDLEGKEEKDVIMQLLQEKGLRKEFANNPRAVNEITNAFKEVCGDFDFANKKDIENFRKRNLPEKICIHDNGINMYKDPKTFDKKHTGLNQDMINFESKNFLLKDEKFVSCESKNTIYKDVSNAKLDFAFNSVEKEFDSYGIETNRISEEGYRKGEDIHSVGYNDNFSSIEDAKKLGIYGSKADKGYYDKETTITREDIGTCRAVSKSKDNAEVETKYALLRSDRNISDLDDVLEDNAVFDLNTIKDIEGQNAYVKAETDKLLKSNDKDPYKKGVEKIAEKQGYKVGQINQRD